MADNEKQSLRESLKLLGYGLKTAHRLIPAYFPCVLLRSLITSAQPLIILFFSARILNELNGAQDIRMTVTYISATIGFTFLLSVIKAFLVRTIETHASWDQTLRRIDMEVAERFATMDFAHTEDGKVSETLARMDLLSRSSGRGLISIFADTPEITNSLFSAVFACVLLIDPLSVGGFGSAPKLGSLALYGLFAIGLFIGVWLRKKETPRLDKIITKAANTNALADYYYEHVSSAKAAKDVRIYNQSELLSGIFTQAFTAKPWISFFNFRGSIDGFSLGLMAVVSGGFYLLVGYGALDGVVPVGSIVQTVGAITALAGAIGSFIGQVGTFYNNAIFIEPMREYLTLPDILNKHKKKLPKDNAGVHSFEFRNVSYRYTNTERFALQNVNLRINHGERLAIVGLNGSGKTTLVKLLCRLYDPTEGEILLDGNDIKELDYSQYTSLFSVVFQDYKLFPLPLGQNVVVKECYDNERVFKSLDDAGFTNRMNAMPDGLGTILYKEYDEDGTTISGGESQKIALARALHKDAPIVVLDEPTAALDPIAEFEVYSTLDRTIGSKTAVFISHRLSSCRFCNRIAVFEGGLLIQLGTHDELLSDLSGRYRELWEAQAQYYT